MNLTRRKFIASTVAGISILSAPRFIGSISAKTIVGDDRVFLDFKRRIVSVKPNSERMTVIDFYRTMNNHFDNAFCSSDLVDVTMNTPAWRITDQAIEMLDNWKLDEGSLEYIYGGTIIQDNGNTIYQGFCGIGSYDSDIHSNKVRDEPIAIIQKDNCVKTQIIRRNEMIRLNGRENNISFSPLPINNAHFSKGSVVTTKQMGLTLPVRDVIYYPITYY